MARGPETGNPVPRDPVKWMRETDGILRFLYSAMASSGARGHAGTMKLCAYYANRLGAMESRAPPALKRAPQFKAYQARIAECRRHFISAES